MTSSWIVDARRRHKPVGGYNKRSLSWNTNMCGLDVQVERGSGVKLDACWDSSCQCECSADFILGAQLLYQHSINIEVAIIHYSISKPDYWIWLCFIWSLLTIQGKILILWRDLLAAKSIKSRPIHAKHSSNVQRRCSGSYRTAIL